MKFIISFYGVYADVQGDIVVAFAEHVQEGVGAIDHGKGCFGARPGWNDRIPSSPIVFFKTEDKLAFFVADDAAGLSCELDFEDGGCLTQQVVGIDHEMGFGGETVMGQSSPSTLRFHENDNLVVVVHCGSNLLINSYPIRIRVRELLGSQGALTRGFCRLRQMSLG